MSDSSLNPPAVCAFLLLACLLCSAGICCINLLLCPPCDQLRNCWGRNLGSFLNRISLVGSLLPAGNDDFPLSFLESSPPIVLRVLLFMESLGFLFTSPGSQRPRISCVLDFPVSPAWYHMDTSLSNIQKPLWPFPVFCFVF